MIDMLGDLLFIGCGCECAVLIILVMYFFFERRWLSLFRYSSLFSGLIFFSFSLWASIWSRDGWRLDSVASAGITAVIKTLHVYPRLLLAGGAALIIGAAIFVASAKADVDQRTGDV